MAVPKNSIRRSTKTKPHKPPQRQSPAKPSSRTAYGRRVEFPEMKGRTVENIEFYTSPDYHSISVTFDDKTSLSLDIDPIPAFIVTPMHEKWKGANARVLRRWPTIRSET
jgi:hypothetical protein